jgi:hypothetical protein
MPEEKKNTEGASSYLPEDLGKFYASLKKQRPAFANVDEKEFFSLFDVIGNIESDRRLDANNPESTAYGPLQYIDQREIKELKPGEYSSPEMAHRRLVNSIKVLGLDLDPSSFKPEDVRKATDLDKAAVLFYADIWNQAKDADLAAAMEGDLATLEKVYAIHHTNYAGSPETQKRFSDVMKTHEPWDTSRWKDLFTSNVVRQEDPRPEPEQADPRVLGVATPIWEEHAAGTGKSGIHIRKENRGKFTAAAKRAGKSVQAYASSVLANKEDHSPALVKRANFARNAAKWKHASGTGEEGIQKDLTAGKRIKPQIRTRIKETLNNYLKGKT